MNLKIVMGWRFTIASALSFKTTVLARSTTFNRRQGAQLPQCIRTIAIYLSLACGELEGRGVGGAMCPARRGQHQRRDQSRRRESPGQRYTNMQSIAIE